MYELVQIGDRTYYINAPSKVGVFLPSPGEAWFIDSGNDKESARRLAKTLREQGWTLKGIANTHSNADHIGGNAGLVQRTGCKVTGTPLENAFTRFPLLEPSFLYGGFPMKGLRNKFLMAESSEPVDLSPEVLPEEMKPIPLGGHFFDMCGYRTADNIVFLADCVFGEATISRYHIFFIYDVAAFLETLDKVEGMEATLFVPSHTEPVADIRPLVDLNRKKVLEILSLLEETCKLPLNFEEVLKKTFDHYGLTLDLNQYVLAGSTVKSYLSYLCDHNRMEAFPQDNRLLFRRI